MSAQLGQEPTCDESLSLSAVAAAPDSDTLIRREIMQRMEGLERRLGEMLRDWSSMVSADEGARCARLVAVTLNEVTGALDAAYRRRLAGVMHPLEMQYWIPALESVRQDLRRAATSLNAMRGPRLERAVRDLQRSLSAVESRD